MLKCIFESHIVMRSQCETVHFVNVSPIDAFDVFESYEVFLFSIRAFYALVLSIYFCKHGLSHNAVETIWDDLLGFCLAPIIFYVS